METVSLNGIVKPDYQTSEAFKRLRTNIMFSGSDIKVIGITSSIQREGKSRVSFGLGLSMALAGKKVVYVDADLRKSVTIGRYRVNKAVVGLTHYLSGLKTEEQVVYQTNVNNLHMVFSGPVAPNPTELLGNERFSKLMDNLRRDFDYVILDTAPLGLVIDAAVTAGACDGMIIVLSAGEVSYKFAQQVKQQLEKTGCRILGTILNNVNMSKSSYYGKYYGKYYGNAESAARRR